MLLQSEVLPRWRVSVQPMRPSTGACNKTGSTQLGLPTKACLANVDLALLHAPVDAPALRDAPLHERPPARQPIVRAPTVQATHRTAVTENMDKEMMEKHKMSHAVRSVSFIERKKVNGVRNDASWKSLTEVTIPQAIT